MTAQISPERDLVSIGCLAAQLQQSVRAIERATIDLSIMPAMRINSVPHFDGAQVEQIRTKLQSEKT